jgi:hypothetical protein
MSGSFDFTSGFAGSPLAINQSLTISAWVKPLADIAADATVAGSFQLAANGSDRAILKALSTQQAQAYLFQSGGGAAVSQNSVSTLTTGVWSPITARFNGDGGTSPARLQEVYFSGALESGASSNARLLNGQEIGIGRKPSGADNFPGLITRISFWSADISAAKIAQLADPSFDPLSEPTSLFAYYDGTSFDDAGTLKLQDMSGNARHLTLSGAVASTDEPGTGYTQRKGSTFDVTHTLGTITTATLNGTAITINTTGAGTVNLTDISGIATSGEYNLVLGDGTGTETYTVQLNVVGLASYNINKDGADQASLADVEFIVMTGAAGSRVIAEQITGVTTDVSGNTGAIEITDVSMNADDVVTILQQSATVGGGLPHSATLVAL